METSQEPRASFFIYFCLYFSLSLPFKAICSMGSGCSHSVLLLPLSTPRAVGQSLLLLCEVLFASTTTQTVTSFTRRHWRVPSSGNNLFLHGLRAGGSPFLLLFLHHTWPSASLPSAPATFGPFSQAAFSTPVLLAASCKTANHRIITNWDGDGKDLQSKLAEGTLSLHPGH